MDYPVERKRIRSSCNGCSFSLKPSIKLLNACSILFENTPKKICKESEMQVDQLAREILSDIFVDSHKTFQAFPKNKH